MKNCPIKLANFLLVTLVLGSLYGGVKTTLVSMVSVRKVPSEFVSPLPDNRPVTAKERHDTTASIIDRVLARYHSPFVGKGDVFYDAGVEHNIDPYLLVAISGAESTFGKRYPLRTNNHMGWGSGSIAFPSVDDCIKTVSSKIASLPYYKKFMQTKKVRDFALAYNAPYAAKYEKTISYFIAELEAEEWK